LESRLPEIQTGLYPKHHLWGIDALEKQDNYHVDWIKINNSRFHPLVERILNRSIFRGSLGVNIERAIIRASHNTDLIYSVCGPPGVAKYLSDKVISWVFRPFEKSAQSTIYSYSHGNLSANKAFFCLTPNAEKYYSQYAISKFIPWCVDLDLFDGKHNTHNQGAPFFLATGKTGRDYTTLVKAAPLVNAEIRIIGPSKQKPAKLPSNVNWIDTTSDPPDQAIDYPTLRDWYAQCIAVCIPLCGDVDDTCGYTNMLEAMAMRKPVLMTQSGCLHINPDTDGFGIQIKSRDAEGWINAMNLLHEDHEKALKMGNRGREIVERDFTIERFNQDVLGFIETILNKS
jgi:glycosyltransferase involved in cell wall biosynthesis